MKRFMSLVLAAVTVVVLLASCSAPETDPEAPKGMVRASSKDIEYVMYVPDKWKLDKSDVYTSAFVSPTDPTSVSTAVFAAEQGTTLEDWWKNFYKDFSEVYENVSEPVVEETKLDGEKAAKYSFKGTLGGKEYSYIIVAAMSSSTVYYVTYTSTGDYYEAHLEELQQILDNFKIK